MKLHVDIDYKNNVFELPILTRIIGEPSTATLIDLRNELRCNAQSVTTTLGGGKYGHLGLVMSDTLYATLPNTAPYVRPAYPGPFRVSNANATEAEITQEKSDYDESMRLWREVEAVERALVQQIVAAVEPKYLKALRNQITTKIMRDVKGILSYLFDNYGKVPPAVLKDMKRRVEDYDLDPNDPVDLLFVEIDELADVYTLQKNPMTDTQLVEIAYVVIEKAKSFKKDLRDWNRKPQTYQTWGNFKIHFRDAQQELRRSGDLTIKEAMGREEMINVVTESINSVIQEQKEEEAEKENVESINAIITKEKDDIKKQFDELKKQMETIKKQALQPLQPFQQLQPWQYNQTFQQPPPPMYNPYQQNNRQRYNNNNRRRNNYNNNRYQGNGRYCWTHGACDHWGRNCRNKANGHVDDATFADTKGGSMNRVRT